MFSDILEVNWLILYFICGQVFFVMGLATGLQWRRRSSMEFSRSLPWLAAFGVSHGFNAWAYIFIPLQSLYLGEAAVQVMVIAHLLLHALSFFFLLQYGIELVRPLVPWRRWLRAMPAAMLLLWAGAVLARGLSAQDSLTTLFNLGDTLSRYMLCLPGACLAGVGLLRQAAHVRRAGLGRISGSLTGAAVAFFAFAVVGGLLVPAAWFFPASVFNYTLLSTTIRVPAPVFRSICGLAMAVFMVRSLDIFRVETDSKLAAMEHARLLAEDRERIGRELHDGIIQKIYATGLSLEVAQAMVEEQPVLAQARIQAAMQSLTGTVEDIRRYIFNLHAAEQSRELEVLLENLIREIRLDTMVEANLEVVGQRCCVLGTESATHVAQIAREALSNVVQHAGATEATVRLSYLGDRTELAITDNGKGLDPATADNGNGTGRGLANIRARARLLGGSLSVETAPGQGLRLTVTFPCGGNLCAGSASPPGRVAHLD
ncbi:MAG TPA: sensor histidine kinase [Anaerolineae bacterium]|nr:sensor histidine kinase [Anaerolineae bacterium]